MNTKRHKHIEWRVGTSGWSYDSWIGIFYPETLKQEEWLHFYAEHFDSVEINNSFYHLITREQVARWQGQVGPDFLFAMKGSRYITHMKRLKNVAEPLARFMQPIARKRKVGPLVFQLPPKFPKDLDRLRGFLALLPRHRRIAIEFRDSDWHDEVVYAELRKRNVAFCLFEKASARSPRVVTANFTYTRLHGRKEGYKGRYSDRALLDWRDWLGEQGRDAYLYFDNTDEKLHAIENALTFCTMTS